jgi:hypothetical protein
MAHVSELKAAIQFPFRRGKTPFHFTDGVLQRLYDFANLGLFEVVKLAVGKIADPADSKQRIVGPILRELAELVTLLLRALRVCPKTSGGITEFSEHEAD